MAIGNPFDTIANFVKGIGPDGEQRDRAATSDDAQLISDWEEMFKRAQEDRRQYERDWQTNLAFLKGQQWLEFSKQTSSLYLPPAPPWRVRHVANLIQPVYRTMYGKVTAQSLHRGRVRPTNETSDSRQDAEAQDELLEYLWSKTGSEEQTGEVIRWAIITGTGIHHPCWDKSKGDPLPPVPDPETGQATPVTDDSGNPIRLGDVDHIAVSPMEFYPEPMVATTEDMEWCVYVKVRPASYILRKYGVKMEG